MNKVDFKKMTDALKMAGAMYPTCRIGNCDCNELNNKEWKKDCKCFGHFKDMDTKFGKEWTLLEFGKEAENR